jgi:hypothetical protein
MSLSPEFVVVVFALRLHPLQKRSVSDPVASIVFFDAISTPHPQVTPHSIDNLDIPVLSHPSSRNLLPLGPHQVFDGPLLPLFGGFVKPT